MPTREASEDQPRQRRSPPKENDYTQRNNMVMAGKDTRVEISSSENPSGHHLTKVLGPADSFDCKGPDI